MNIFKMLTILLLTVSPLWSAPVAIPALPAGVTVLSGSNALKIFEAIGAEVKNGKTDLVELKGEPYAQALRMTTEKLSTTKWNIQAHALYPKDLKQDDILLVQFAMRSVSGGAETAEGQSEFVLELNSDPWTKSIETSLTAPREWKTYSLPFKIVNTMEAEKSHISFRMGYKPQVLEVADLKIIAYPSGTDFKLFPRTLITYKGREFNAPWRKEALARIQKIRKGDLTISVKDASGKPVAGASVMVAMTRHTFTFGTAVQAKRLAGFDMDPERYKKEILKNFNTIVFENDLKWPFWESALSGNDTSWRKVWIDESMDWAEKEGLSIKGHNLVWPSWRFSPTRLKEFEKDPKKMQAEILKHIREIAGAMKGRLTEWDVMNESVHEKDLINLCGRPAMVEWFKTAREADPTAKLYINEYGIFSGGGADYGTQDAYEADIQYLIDAGAPLDGIGIQSHLGQTFTSPEVMLQILDRFGKFGKTIKITELDFNAQDDAALSYEYMKDYLITLFSHPAVGGLLMWGFWDGAQWMKQGPLYTIDWKLKPSGKAWREMIYKEWWTQAAGKSNGSGMYTTRGFFGNYDVAVSFANKKQVVKTTLDATGKNLVVTLK